MPSRGPANSAISKFLRTPPDSNGGEAVAAPIQPCPLCAAPMVMLTAPSGPHEGHPIWSCSSYPTCRGTIVIEPDAEQPAEVPSMVDALRRWWADRIR